MNRLHLLAVAAAIGLLTVASVVSAAPADRSTSDINVIATEDTVGTSTLVRNDNGVNMTFRTTGLEPDTVATIWWVIFNNPGECDDPGNCTGTDFDNPDVDASVFYAAGHVIGGSGRANYGAHLPVDRLTVDPDPDANQLIVGDGILKDARDAEVHLVLRTHGPVIPDLVDQQLNTFDAGCTTAPPDLQGPNSCQNLHSSIHRP